jgi:hypothetical protein
MRFECLTRRMRWMVNGLYCIGGGDERGRVQYLEMLVRQRRMMELR